jgi:glycerophosphoryl diester phosphodiesterase
MRWSLSKPIRPRRPDWLTARPFAHRGLHSAGIPENSRAAFEAAIAAGNGIELDVQPCRGGAAVVFHDQQLDRLCEVPGRIDRLSLADVSAIRLAGSEETIPTFKEVLALIHGRTPLLVEIKTPGRRWGPLCRSVADSLAGYAGPVAVMSFRTAAIAWFARNAPHILRGLVMSDEGSRKRPLLRGLALRAAAPDFLAYDIRSLPSTFAGRARDDGLAILSWTVRSLADLQKARLHADQIIHELPAGEAS